MPSWTYVLGNGMSSNIFYIANGFGLPIIVLVVILDGQEGVSEDVNEGHSYRRAEPAVTGWLHRVFQLYPSQSFKKREGSQTSEFKKKTFSQCSLILATLP